MGRGAAPWDHRSLGSATVKGMQELVSWAICRHEARLPQPMTEPGSNTDPSIAEPWASSLALQRLEKPFAAGTDDLVAQNPIHQGLTGLPNVDISFHMHVLGAKTGLESPF